MVFVCGTFVLCIGYSFVCQMDIFYGRKADMVWERVYFRLFTITDVLSGKEV